MNKFICLQSGHEGRVSGVVGAPGEIELNVRIRNRLSEILISKGFVLQLVNADPKATEINKDFDLFLALHADANIYGTGGGVVACIAPPPFDSSEVANAESRRIRDAIISEYFDHSGIVNHPERSNKNMTEYYMWSKLTAKTPCVIIEMGVVQDAHDKVLLADTERIATALARGVCKAFGVEYDPKPDPLAECLKIHGETLKQLEERQKLLEETQKQLNSSQLLLKDLNAENKMLKAQNAEFIETEAHWQSVVDLANKKVSKLEEEKQILEKEKADYKRQYENKNNAYNELLNKSIDTATVKQLFKALLKKIKK